ncbi:MAG: hypothetical protein FWH12_07780 [Treponema sp.]|nr:hypothetical protein [Treponema sp.]
MITTCPWASRFKKLLFAALISMPLLSCTATIHGELFEGGSGEVDLILTIENQAQDFIRRFRNISGVSAETAILEGPAMSRLLGALPGIAMADLRNPHPAFLGGFIGISHVGDILRGQERDLFSYTEGAAPGSSSLVLVLDRETVPAFLSQVSPEAEGYLSLLMAPVLLGESLNKDEYLALLAMVYGQALTNEIASSVIQAQIAFPRPIQSIQGGRAQGNLADFEIPLLDLLVMEEALRYELSW